MTISTTTIKNSYSANGSTTVFNYTFKITDQDDIEVITRASNGTETVKTLTTDYTVSGVGNAGGGSITFGTAPASGLTVILRRDTPQTQGADFIENDPLNADTLEDALDKLTSITQELQEENDRSIKLSRTNTMTSTEFTVGASDRANKVLAFDSSGEISVAQELGTYQGTDATTTTAAYQQRDIIKSTTAAQLNNVYICVADSVVGDLLTDTDHFELLVDAVSAATSATNAAASATTATTKASEASTSATNAATSETNAATSESNASTSETNAATSATNAATSETNAATSATNAATSESNAAASATAAAAAAGGGTVSITDADTTAEKLNDKLLVSGGLTKTTNNAGSAETLTLGMVAAEVYGFNKNASGELIVTTTNQGADDISEATYAAFDDVLFSASGFTFSINSSGNLIATI